MPRKRKIIGWTACLTCNTIIEIRVFRPHQKWCSQECRSRTPQDRFWSFVDRKSEIECWPWKGSANKSGAGRFNPNPNNRGVLAPRYSWELHFGTIPKGLQVCHHCDNPPCVNPDHLFLGTAYDNCADKVAKNRQSKGERNGKPKLKESYIPRIRELFQEGVTAAKIGEDYGVCDQTILDIIHRKLWKHVL